MFGCTIATLAATRFPIGMTSVAADCAACCATGSSVVLIVRPPSNSSLRASSSVGAKDLSFSSRWRTRAQKNGATESAQGSAEWGGRLSTTSPSCAW